MALLPPVFLPVEIFYDALFNADAMPKLTRIGTSPKA
jgi:hypothetical protein